MNEIEKMYRNAGVESVGFNPYKLEDEYPSFTSEKQLELIKFCFEKYGLLGKTKVTKDRCILYNLRFPDDYPDYVNCETWEEAIAGLINNLWQDLTDAEKVQIRNILESEMRK